MFRFLKITVFSSQWTMSWLQKNWGIWWCHDSHSIH